MCQYTYTYILNLFIGGGGVVGGGGLCILLLLRLEGRRKAEGGERGGRQREVRGEGERKNIYK